MAGTFDGVFDHDGTRVVASGIDSFVLSAIRSGAVRWARATDDSGFDQVEHGRPSSSTGPAIQALAYTWPSAPPRRVPRPSTSSSRATAPTPPRAL